MPAPVRPGGAIRRFAANFWLDFVFFHATYAPWLVRATKGYFLWWIWNCSRSVHDATLTNARRILGEASTPAQRRILACSTICSILDFIYDIGRTSRMSRDQLKAQIAQTVGIEHYHQARALGKGAIIATAHMGSFELGIAGLAEREKRVHVVFQRDYNPIFEELRSGFRKLMGIQEAAVDDGWGVWLKLRDALLADEVVAIQADRAMPGQIGVKVPFLGGHCLFPEGPAKLAAITASPILPVFTVRHPDGRVTCHIEEAILLNGSDEVAITEAIAKLAQIVGRYVQAHPEQWLVLHRAWCEDMQ